jgi:hypothetical protein
LFCKGVNGFSRKKDRGYEIVFRQCFKVLYDMVSTNDILRRTPFQTKWKP